ncbi:MAG: PqqD family protein [Ruminococcus sp.]|jgi:hypothetical protein|nr:PqqD family protein [Ruminococcus sp.]
MKVKEGFLLRSFGDEYIVVAVGEGSEDFNKLITLNSVGGFIFKELSEDISRDELVKKIVDYYEIDRQLAERDCDSFIEKLKDAELLEGC